MAIDLLGTEEPKKPKKREEELRYHIPQEEFKKKKKVKEKIEEKKEERSEKKVEKVAKKAKRVNLVTPFSSGVAKRRLRFTILFAIIVVLIAAGGYVAFILLQRETITLPEVQRVAPEVQAPAPVSIPVEVEEPKVTLPDTPLAPLRGSLVRFSGDPTIYLVEENGELRKVLLQTVIFDNGQRIGEIELSRIYLINSSWQSVRKGGDVMGQVDWDPRVLLPGEIDSFL